MQDRKFAEENFKVLLRHIMHKTNSKQKELAEMLGFESAGYVSRLLQEDTPAPESPALMTAICALARIVSDDRAEFERELHRKPLPEHPNAVSSALEAIENARPALPRTELKRIREKSPQKTE